MKLFGETHILLSVITFIILFLMNYLGNEEPDKIQRGLLNAAAGVVGLSIGLFILYKNRNSGQGPDFD